MIKWDSGWVPHCAFRNELCYSSLLGDVRVCLGLSVFIYLSVCVYACMFSVSVCSLSVCACLRVFVFVYVSVLVRTHAEIIRSNLVDLDYSLLVLQ